MSSKSGELPLGWCWATVGDTGKYINGFAFKPEHREATGRPIVRIQNLTDPDKPLNRTSLAVSEDFHVATGEMLLSWSATVDVFVWNREASLVNQHIFRVAPDERLVDKTFLFHWLKVAIDQLLDSEHLHGSTMKHINRGPFLAHRIPLPPLPEQQRIAETLEELLSDLDAGMVELRAAQRKLAQCRQSLLKAAVEGALTADWRAAHGKPKEAGAELLQRILSERRARWEQRQLARFAEQGKTLPKGWQTKYPEPVAPDLTDLPSLPEGWAWASLDQLAEIQGGIQKQPSRAPIANRYPFLRVANVARGQLKLDEIHEIELFEGELERLALQTGDILVVEGNGSLTEIGRCALWDGSIENAVHQNHLIRARPVLVKGEFIEAWLNSLRGIQRMTALAATTSGLYTLSVGKISKIPVPLPPLSEQEVAMESLAAALTGCREQVAATDRSLKQAAAQRKNLLKAAFAGQLVPQDPHDEPASDLLARIRTERASNDGGAPRRRRKTA